MLPIEAAEYASKAVASYLENRILPINTPDELSKIVREPVELAGGKIYLAGPFRELGQRVLINEARTLLKSMGMDVTSPVHDIGHGVAEEVVPQDLAAIDECDAVFAILNGSSPGTVFEVGYAASKGKPTFCLAQNMRNQDLKLPRGSGADIHDDFVSALHRLAWRK